jgi:hypothetical protein
MQLPEIEKLVAEQIARISQKDLAGTIRSLLVSPRLEQRPWDYGAPDQTYPCWIVAEHKPSNTAFAFCESGFGPKCPWGVIFISGPHPSIGADYSWYTTLEDAVRESFAWEGENPPGYEVS